MQVWKKKLCIRHEEHKAREMRGRERWNPLVTHVPIPSSLRGGGNAQVLAAESLCLAPMGDGVEKG